MTFSLCFVAPFNSYIDLSSLLLFYSADSVCLSLLRERTRLEFKGENYTPGLWVYINVLAMINVPTPQGMQCRITWFTPAPCTRDRPRAVINTPWRDSTVKEETGCDGVCCIFQHQFRHADHFNKDTFRKKLNKNSENSKDQALKTCSYNV